MRGVDDNDDADRFRLSVHVEPRALADLFSTSYLSKDLKVHTVDTLGCSLRNDPRAPSPRAFQLGQVPHSVMDKASIWLAALQLLGASPTNTNLLSSPR